MTPEEKEQRRQAILDRNKKSMELVEKIIAASNDGDQETSKKLLDEMKSLDPDYCEHERHWSSDCIACDDLFKELFPEHFEKCSKCEAVVDHDELKDSRCFDCQGE